MPEPEKNVNTAKNSRNPTIQNLNRSLDQTVHVVTQLRRGLGRAGSRREVNRTRRLLADVNRLRRNMNQVQEYADRLNDVSRVMGAVGRLRRIDFVRNPDQGDEAARQFDILFSTLGSMLGDLPPPVNMYGRLFDNWGNFFQDMRRGLLHTLLDPQMALALREGRTNQRGVMQPGERR